MRMKLNVEHDSVMLDEATSFLISVKGGTYVDGTFGGGGHSRAILNKLSSEGKLLAIDRDPDAFNFHAKLKDRRFIFQQACFSQLTQLLSAHRISCIDGVLLDLGVSSPQIDTTSRGFSFIKDGPLDMRMNNTEGESVADWLASADEQEISQVLRDFGQERFARRIAKAIVYERRKNPIHTTLHLVEVIKLAVTKKPKNKHFATKTFQAFRIRINRELQELTDVLPQCVDVLKPGGRIVVISFHSLEDGIVKRFFKGEAQPQVPRKIPIRYQDMPQARLRLVGKAIIPSEKEVKRNPRARSAIMRVAERLIA